ncbi:MAG: hypothetical protein ACPGOY_13905 [Rhodospirillaceae bacterium]
MKDTRKMQPRQDNDREVLIDLAIVFFSVNVVAFLPLGGMAQ